MRLPAPGNPDSTPLVRVFHTSFLRIVPDPAGTRTSNERIWIPIVDAFRTLVTCPPPAISNSLRFREYVLA